MPELPEVETIARQLRERGVEGRKIIAVRVGWPRTIEPLSVPEFSEKLIGATIDEISRVGKWMVFSLGSGQALLVHLRMAGSFALEPGRYDRVVLELSGGLTLHYRDPRKFGRWKLVNDPGVILGALGPDALTPRFSPDYFREELSRRHRKVKALLLDQSMVAGLGNIYADEALWEAMVHPERLSDSLSEEETMVLFQAIRHVLQVGIRNRGTSLGEGKANYRDVEGKTGEHREEVKAYGRSGKPCERCGTRLEKIVVVQRGSTFCPVCQVI
jgi:formamidopyrimidine-DNA glycosylase